MKKLASILFLFCLLPVVNLQAKSHDATVLGKAFAKSAKGDHAAAASIAKQGSKLVQDIVAWREMMSTSGRLTLKRLEYFTNGNVKWPNQTKLQKLIEGNLPLTNAESKVIELFTEHGALRTPYTARGKLVLAMALLKQQPAGLFDKKQAVQWLREGWAGASLNRTYRNHVRNLYGKHLREQDHAEKIATLIHEGNTEAANSMMVLVGKKHTSFFNTWMRLKAKKTNPFEIHKAVPKKFRSHELFLYDLYRYDRKHRKRFSKEWLLQQLPNELKYPEKWWKMTRYQINNALKKGDARYAYGLASSHSFPADTEHNTSFSDAEWLAGWISLRFLNKPKQAYRHFYTMYNAVKTPISLGRAGYWLGRASDDLNNSENAAKWYDFAAQFDTTYYGQLAKQKRGGKRIALSEAGNDNSILRNPLVKAGALLHEAGQHNYAIRFFTQAVENANSPAQGEALLKHIKRFGRDDYGVWVAKRLSHITHHIADAHYYPQHNMTTDVQGNPITAPELPLIYAITLQESLFNPTVKSHAGARGLMQLMPATAKRVSKDLGLRYKRDKLTKDPRYNVTLGSKYLADRIEEFDGSYILAIASYNAGPGNARKWIAANRDPRRLRSVEEVVDWIEMIPFNETRNYVMRVTENVQVYRHLLNRRATLQLEKDLLR